MLVNISYADKLSKHTQGYLDAKLHWLILEDISG